MMEQLPEENFDAVELEDTASVASVGRQLREARERLGMSVEEVVAKIKIAQRQIVALEADDFQSLPETAFMRGFVRSYAKLLQLDAQPLLDALPGAQPAIVETPQVNAPFPSEKTLRQQNINLLLAALLVSLLIAGFVYWQSSTVYAPPVATEIAVSEVASVPLTLASQPEILDAESAAVSAPVAVLEAASATAQAVSTLRLVFDKESWAEIKDQSGKTLSRQVNLAGSELNLEGVAPFTLVIGHAAAVHLYYRDKPVDLSAYVNASSDVARMTLE